MRVIKLKQPKEYSAKTSSGVLVVVFNTVIQKHDQFTLWLNTANQSQFRATVYTTDAEMICREMMESETERAA
jgi:hypothetical protein